MRAVFFAALSSSALLVSTIAFADDAKPVAPTPTASTDDSDKLVCHVVSHEGQVIGKACHTQKEWDQIQFRDQQELRNYQRQSLYGNPQ